MSFFVRPACSLLFSFLGFRTHALVAHGTILSWCVPKPSPSALYQLERTEAAVELVANPQLKERAEQALPNEGIQQLERVDAMLGKLCLWMCLVDRCY